MAIFCFCLLKFEILRHQIFSLIIIFICLTIIIIFEYIANEQNKEDSLSFSFILLIMSLYCFFISLKDIIEKYLLEYDFINPFKVLMLEGIIGFILSNIYTLIIYLFIYQNLLDELLEINYNSYSITLFIFFLILYFIFSGFKNTYRIITIKLFSPMTRTITDSFLNPILILYYFFLEDDFKINNIQKIYYFIINLILSFFIVFCGFVYNEFLVLFFCSLERDTYYEISKRAKKLDESDDSWMSQSYISMKSIDSKSETQL